MKRLLVLFLVLGLVSSANAALAWFEVDAADADYAAGDTITINLVADAAVAAANIYYVAEMDSAGNQADFGGVASALNVAPSPAGRAAGALDNYQGALWSFEASSWNGANIVAAGSTIVTFEYTIASDWDGSDIVIGALGVGKMWTIDGDGWEVEDESTLDIFTGTIYETQGGIGSVTLSSVPEPMTIALLGLGGLFLRRRK